MTSAQRRYYERNKAKVIADAAARRKTPAGRAWFQQYNYDPETWAQRACYQMKHKAKQLGIEFDMKPEDLQVPAVCPFTLLPFDFDAKSGKPRAQSPSVDRIKPNKGYVRGNVRVISLQANSAKSDITDPDVFQRLADDARLWSLV
jgi:hypothetical protein